MLAWFRPTINKPQSLVLYWVEQLLKENEAAPDKAKGVLAKTAEVIEKTAAKYQEAWTRLTS